PVGRPVMNGETEPLDAFMVMMREVLLPWPGAPRTPWLESVTNNRPPLRPFSNASPIAGPSGGNPPPVAVGLPNDAAILLPCLSSTITSGVNGLFAANLPTPGTVALLLQAPGKPVPDSSTYTLKLCSSPTNAMSVGKFKFLAKTSIL